MKWLAAAPLLAIAIACFVAGWKIPLEAGSVLFAPILLTAGALSLLGAAKLVLPKRPPSHSARPWFVAAAALAAVAWVVERVIGWLG